MKDAIGFDQHGFDGLQLRLRFSSDLPREGLRMKVLTQGGIGSHYLVAACIMFESE
jgi:hypothetical protein